MPFKLLDLPPEIIGLIQDRLSMPDLCNLLRASPCIPVAISLKRREELIDYSFNRQFYDISAQVLNTNLSDGCIHLMLCQFVLAGQLELSKQVLKMGYTLIYNSGTLQSHPKSGKCVSIGIGILSMTAFLGRLSVFKFLEANVIGQEWKLRYLSSYLRNKYFVSIDYIAKSIGNLFDQDSGTDDRDRHDSIMVELIATSIDSDNLGALKYLVPRVSIPMRHRIRPRIMRWVRSYFIDYAIYQYLNETFILE